LGHTAEAGYHILRQHLLGSGGAGMAGGSQDALADQVTIGSRQARPLFFFSPRDHQGGDQLHLPHQIPAFVVLIRLLAIVGIG